MEFQDPRKPRNSKNKSVNSFGEHPVNVVTGIFKVGQRYKNVVALNNSNIFFQMLAQGIGYYRLKFCLTFIFLWPISNKKDVIQVETLSLTGNKYLCNICVCNICPGDICST